MNRPKIDIPKEPIDWLLEFIGWAAIFFIVAYPLYHYGGLPDRIPTHFGPEGQPDAYGPKATIWTLPIVAILTFSLFVILNRKPHIFNYPTKITEENAFEQYQFATRLMRFLNSIISAFLAYITYGIVQTALGNQSGLNGNYLWLFLLLIFGAMAYYFWLNYQKSSLPVTGI
jgi:uncharacterized membrane protein